MVMKTLSEYNNVNEAFMEIQKKFPVLAYQPDDENYYEMLYYGRLPDYGNNDMFSFDFIRIYYVRNTETVHYVACIEGDEPENTIVCNDKTVDEIIEMFKKDIEESKYKANLRRMKSIKKDF